MLGWSLVVVVGNVGLCGMIDRWMILVIFVFLRGVECDVVIYLIGWVWIVLKVVELMVVIEVIGMCDLCVGLVDCSFIGMG